MSQAQFILLVRDMRNAQKNYFRTRDKIVLEESKRLEREVDAVIKQYLTPQMELGI